MRVSRRLAVLSAAAVTAASLTAVASAAPAPATASTGVTSLSTSWPGVPVAERLQPWLAEQLALGDSEPLRVMVSGETTAAAQSAATAAGLRVQQVWDKVGIVVAVGLPAQISAVVPLPGVRNVSGDQPLAYTLDTSHQATRSDLALAEYEAADGSRVDGSGVTVAVIDSGIDGTHPFFSKDGVSKVVRNVKNFCGLEIVPECFQQDPTNDTDTKSGGGHGTHVAGIVAGYEVTTTDPAGVQLRGAAPGAKLVGLSVGAAIGLLDATAAMNWVVEHQRRPCATADDQDGPIDPACPPIRATNHSYGPATAPEEGFAFDEDDPAVTVQRALVEQGVTVVWAAGNSAGDGSIAQTNPPAMDPTPGIVMVASYDDAQSGARDNQLSSFSSRGKQGATGSYPDVAAPGDLITSACRPTLAICQGAPSYDGGDYQTISGTSMATPYTAGVVAQLVQAEPTTSPGEVEDLLEDTAHAFTAGGPYETDPLNTDGTTSFDKGHGLVDVLAAVAALQGLPAPAEPAVAAVPVACGGTDLVTDPTADATAPVSGADAGSSQDITAISFAAQDTDLTVTLDVANYTGVPAPGTASTLYVVAWTGPDDTRYAVRHQNVGGDYEVGEYEGGNTFKTGTTSTITGEERSGPDGGITFVVPRELVGNPVIPVTDPAAAGVQGPVGETFGGVGTGATGGATFVAVMDRAPDGGNGPSWSVCTASGGTPTTGGDMASPSPTPSGSPSPSGEPSPPTDPTLPLDPDDSTAGGGLVTLATPERVMDSRNGTGTPRGVKRGDVVLDLSSQVPAGATAGVLNVTVTNPTANGHLVVSPAGRPVPETSNVNFRKHQTQANEVVVRLPADRRVLLHVDSAAAHVVVDLLGWTVPEATSDSSLVRALPAPERVVDTRETAPRRISGELPVSLADSVPAEATGVVLNVTLTGPDRRGFAVVHPTGSSRPETSNVNVEPGQTQANEVVTRIGRDRSISVYVDSTTAAVVVDLVGYLVPNGSSASSLQTLTTPDRVVDTRKGTGLSAGRKSGEVRVAVPETVPAAATAVVLNVTAVGADRSGHVTAYAAGETLPETSNVNFGAGTVQANEVLVPIGEDRSVALHVGGTGTPATHLVVDAVGVSERR